MEMTSSFKILVNLLYPKKVQLFLKWDMCKSEFLC